MRSALIALIVPKPKPTALAAAFWSMAKPWSAWMRIPCRA
jgi:hypothetical protein